MDTKENTLSNIKSKMTRMKSLYEQAVDELESTTIVLNDANVRIETWAAGVFREESTQWKNEEGDFVPALRRYSLGFIDFIDSWSIAVGETLSVKDSDSNHERQVKDATYQYFEAEDDIVLDALKHVPKLLAEIDAALEKRITECSPIQ